MWRVLLLHGTLCILPSPPRCPCFHSLQADRRTLRGSVGPTAGHTVTCPHGAGATPPLWGSKEAVRESRCLLKVRADEIPAEGFTRMGRVPFWSWWQPCLLESCPGHRCRPKVRCVLHAHGDQPPRRPAELCTACQRLAQTAYGVTVRIKVCGNQTWERVRTTVSASSEFPLQAPLEAPPGSRAVAPQPALNCPRCDALKDCEYINLKSQLQLRAAVSPTAHGLICPLLDSRIQSCCQFSPL